MDHIFLLLCVPGIFYEMPGTVNSAAAYVGILCFHSCSRSFFEDAGESLGNSLIHRVS